MRTLSCSFEGCQVKATASCRCKANKYLFFCAEHLGSHFVSPGKHSFEKLYDESNIETKKDFLQYMKFEVQNLEDLKENLIKYVYDEILKLENSLGTYLQTIDEEIAKIKSKSIETLQVLENSGGNLGNLMLGI